MYLNISTNQFLPISNIDKKENRDTKRIDALKKKLHLLSEHDEYNHAEAAEYIFNQNNSSTGYNQQLLAMELHQAYIEKQYSLSDTEEFHEESTNQDNNEEINESEKYAVD